MKLTKRKGVAAAVILILLVATYHLGGGFAQKESRPEEPPLSNVSLDSELNSSESAISQSGTAGGISVNLQKEASSQQGQRPEEEKPGTAESPAMTIDPDTGKDRYLTDPVPEGKPIPVEPQNSVISDRKLTCTLSVRCDTILNNMEYLDPEKVELVPADGVIFPASRVDFYEGESVFHVLLREMKMNKIHMEFVNTPIYNSAYIEGVNNLYEFDCGELSGWMYKVNGWFPNYGCSRYQLKDGDVVEWVYTCDLGRDVGGYYAAGGE